MPLMRFVAIDPSAAKVAIVEDRDLTDCYARVGLDPGRVDHGSLFKDQDTGQSVNIVVGEEGLF